MASIRVAAGDRGATWQHFRCFRRDPCRRARRDPAGPEYGRLDGVVAAFAAELRLREAWNRDNVGAIAAALADVRGLNAASDAEFQMKDASLRRALQQDSGLIATQEYRSQSGDVRVWRLFGVPERDVFRVHPERSFNPMESALSQAFGDAKESIRAFAEPADRQDLLKLILTRRALDPDAVRAVAYLVSHHAVGAAARAAAGKLRDGDALLREADGFNQARRMRVANIKEPNIRAELQKQEELWTGVSVEAAQQSKGGRGGGRRKPEVR